MPAPVGQGASGIRGSVLSHGGRSFVFEAVSETNPLTTLAPAFLLSARDQCERTWPGDQGQTPPKNPLFRLPRCRVGTLSLLWVPSEWRCSPAHRLPPAMFVK